MPESDVNGEFSNRIARYLCQTSYEDLPQETVRVTKRSILDAIGVSLAASSLGEICVPYIEIARAGQCDDGGASIIGCGFRSSPALAAFATGSLAHTLDFEDHLAAP